jgi:predicted enzyme related to lactoylglutathione lyase
VVGMAGSVFPIINCRDLAPVRQFYERVFEGELTYSYPPGGDPVYQTLDVGDGRIAIGLGNDPAMYGEVPLPATGHAVDLCLYVPTREAAVATAEPAGGAVITPPADTPWGERVAYLSDPQGTMLLVIQEAETAS